jgi:tetratricopeptide (TPR) repeat protein
MKQPLSNRLKNVLRGAQHRSVPSYINSLRGPAYGSKRPNPQFFLDAVEAARSNLPVAAYPSLLTEIKALSLPRLPKIGLTKARSYQDIHNRRAFDSLSLERELAWCSAILAEHVETLHVYRDLSLSLEKHLLCGDTETALMVLDDIDSACGLSFWSIELRIALLQLNDGLEGHKEYVHKVHQRAPKALVTYYAYMASERNEESTTGARFSADLDEQLRIHNVSQDREVYLKFRLTGRFPPAKDLARILAQEAATSIIDLYETFLRVITHLAELGQFESYTPLLPSLSLVGDERIAKLRFLGTGETQVLESLRSRDLHADDALFSGDYAKALQLAERAADNNPDDLHALISQAHCRALLGLYLEDSFNLSETIVRHLGGVFAFSDDYLERLGALSKLKLNFEALPTLRGIFSQIQLYAEQNRLRRTAMHTSLFVSSRYLEPMDVVAIPMALREPYLQLCESRYNRHLTLEAAAVAAGVTTHHAALADEQQLRVAQVCLHGTSDRERADVLAKRMLASNHRPVRLQGVLLEAETHLESGALLSAIEHYAHWCSREAVLFYAFPVDRAIGGQSLRELKPNFASLATPISFYVLLQTRDDATTRNFLRWSVDEFLQENALLRPSAIKARLSDFDPNQVVFFLREVCSPQVLEACRGIRTSRALEEERYCSRNLFKRLGEGLLLQPV